MKRKFISVLLALVLVLSFSLVTATPVAASPGTLNVRPYTLAGTNGTSVWSTDQAKTGSASVLLTHDAGGPSSVYVEFVPLTGTTLADLGAATSSSEWSWQHFTEAILANHSQMELRFTQPGGDTDILLDVTAMPLQNHTGSGTTWVKQTLEQATTGLLYYGNNAAGTAYSWETGGGGDNTLKTVSGIIAAIRANAGADSDSVLDALVLTRVRVELWEAGTRTSYIDDITIKGVTYYGLIQDAIDSAVASDIIAVAAGTYTEDLVIPAGKDNLELAGATGATIKGVQMTVVALKPFAEANIDILSAGVKIHGFTIEGPAELTGYYSSGLIIGAGGVKIYDNAFKVTNASTTDELSQGIQTWHVVVVPGVDISGLNIYDNTFTSLGAGTVGYIGIYINRDDTSPTSITIADNVFTGDIYRGIATERSETTISGNSIITDLAINVAGQGIIVMDLSASGLIQDAVTVTGNTVKGSSEGKGFTWGIGLGKTDRILTNISVTKNTVQMNTVGIQVRPTAGGITVNYNDISNNTDGIVNTDTGVELDAENNWWNDIYGPSHAGNPYDIPTNGDTASNNVDYSPWMVHTVLASGWNIYSPPWAPNAATNTPDEALDIIGTDSAKVASAYYFDSSAATPAWLIATSLTPLTAIYLDMTAAATIDVAFSPSYTAPPSRTMYQGWNLIGHAAYADMPVDDALISALYGTGEANLVGYTQIMSPGVNQTTTWTWIRGGDTPPSVIPTEGYWVYMANQGTLGGFTSTPIAIDTTP